MAGPFDFTGQNIQDTYQRVLQTDGTNVYDGTGSLFTLPSAFPFTGSARITGSLTVVGNQALTGSILISGSNFIRFHHTSSGTNANFSDLTVFRYSVYDTPALRLVRPDGIGFTLYRQGSANNFWVGDESGNRNMTLYSSAMGAFTFTAPGQGGDFTFTGGSAVDPAYASSIVFRTFDYNINAVTASDHAVKIQGPNVTGSNQYNLVSFQAGSTFAEKAAIRYNGGAYFSSSVSIGTITPSASLHISGSSTATLLEIDSPTANDLFYVSGSGTTGVNGILLVNGGRVGNYGSFNSLLGLQVGSGGSFNTFIGRQTATTNTGDFNTALGIEAFKFSGAGSQNTAVGAFAGSFRADGSSQVALANNSVFLGYYSRANGTSETNQIVIGHQAIGLGSNSAVLGNDSITRTALKGNVSVGTTGSISSTLHVKGSGATSATTVVRVENTNAAASLVVLDNGFVGINTGSAQYNLDVSGTSGFRARVNIFGEAELRQDGITQTFTSNLGIFRFNAWNASVQTAYLNGWNYEGFLNFAVNIGSGSIATPSAVLEVTSTTRGFRPPRTATTASIASPAQGLMTYLTGSTNEGLYYYNSGSQIGWHRVLTNTGSQSITGSLTVTNTSNFSNGLIISGSTIINDALEINIPEVGGPIDDTRPAGFYKASVNGVSVYLPYYL